TLLLAHVTFSIAFVTVTVRARMAGFDLSVEEAARDLGANAWVTFRKVTLPLIFPGIMAGALMAFALSIDDFVTSNFVSGTAVPFPVWVYGVTRIGIPPQVFVFGAAIFSVGILCAVASVVISRRRVSVGLHGRCPELARAGTHRYRGHLKSARETRFCSRAGRWCRTGACLGNPRRSWPGSRPWRAARPSRRSRRPAAPDAPCGRA